MTRGLTKGVAPDVPFPASIINATRRRCRLTALATAAGAAVPPEPAAVAAALLALGVRLVGAVELYQVAQGPRRTPAWRVEFDVRRADDAYLNASEVGYILGIDVPQQRHKTVRRLALAGFLDGHAFYEGHDPDRPSVLPSRTKRPPRPKGAAPPPGARRWRFHPDDLARFLLAHPEQYDRARVRGNPWRGLAAEAAKRLRWLRVDAVAARLGCTTSIARDMVKRGDLQGVLIRDRRAISYYVRPDWLLDLPDFARPGARRTGAKLRPELAAHRAAILAERVRLQGHYDKDGWRLMNEVRDTVGRRRKAAEAARAESAEAAA